MAQPVHPGAADHGLQRVDGTAGDFDGGQYGHGPIMVQLPGGRITADAVHVDENAAMTCTYPRWCLKTIAAARSRPPPA